MPRTHGRIGHEHRRAVLLDPTVFRSVFARHPAGVAVVAADVGGRPFGLTVSSVVSVSAEPAMLAFSVDAASRGWQLLQAVTSVTINFLSGDQEDVAAHFARRGVDRFEGASWSPLTTGEPVLDGVAAWIRAEIVHSVAVGSSRLLVLAARVAHQEESSSSLVYLDRRYHRLHDAEAG